MNNNFGKRLKGLREERGVLLRQLASFLEVDTAFISKIEKGDRKPTKEHIIKISEFLHVDFEELLILWFADKLSKVIGDEICLGYMAMDYLKMLRDDK